MFNLIVGFAGGHVVGRRTALLCLLAEQTTRAPSYGRDRDLDPGVLRVATARMALNEATLGSEMQHMLGLPFEITMPMIYVTVLAAQRPNRITLSARG